MAGRREGESRDRKDRRPTSKGDGKERKGGESPFRPLGKEREENSPPSQGEKNIHCWTAKAYSDLQALVNGMIVVIPLSSLSGC